MIHDPSAAPLEEAAYPLPAAKAAALVRASLGVAPAHVVKEGPLGSTCYTADGAAFGANVPAVLAIGVFDGFHQGHRALVASAIADAHEQGLPCYVVSFDPDPDELFKGAEAPRELLSCNDRARMALSLGVDGVCMLRFDEAFASMDPASFVHDVLCCVAKPVAVHVGTNFRFGYRGTGTARLLGEYGAQQGFGVVTHDLVEVGGASVSSTRIRGLLAQEGGIEEANALLGRCHYLRGVVEHGRGEGTSFGFPTANVRFPGRSCMPAQGVYGGFVAMDGRAWPAAINVGAPPTFAEADELFCEANLIGFEGDVYGREVTVTFVAWLRASRRFDSLDELERVVLGNIEWVCTNLGDGEVEVGRDN